MELSSTRHHQLLLAHFKLSLTSAKRRARGLAGEEPSVSSYPAPESRGVEGPPRHDDASHEAGTFLTFACRNYTLT